jgi:hypothetical protein
MKRGIPIGVWLVLGAGAFISVTAWLYMAALAGAGFILLAAWLFFVAIGGIMLRGLFAGANKIEHDRKVEEGETKPATIAH